VRGTLEESRWRITSSL